MLCANIEPRFLGVLFFASGIGTYLGCQQVFFLGEGLGHRGHGRRGFAHCGGPRLSEPLQDR